MLSSPAIAATSSTVEIEVRGGAQAGVLLFYNRRLYCGLGFDAERFTMHRYGLERTRAKPDGARAARCGCGSNNDRHIVTLHHSPDGKAWTKFDVQMEVSGYHHNVAGDFLSLRPALFVAGPGEAAVFRPRIPRGDGGLRSSRARLPGRHYGKLCAVRCRPRGGAGHTSCGPEEHVT